MEYVDFNFNNFLIHTLGDNDNDNCDEIQHNTNCASFIANTKDKFTRLSSNIVGILSRFEELFVTEISKSNFPFSVIFLQE